MNTCPNCGKMAGLHSSVLQGCMCQYSMQAMREGKDFTISKPWQGLSWEEIDECFKITPDQYLPAQIYKRIEAKLKEKNK